MISYIMQSLLLILAIALTNSQARTLTDELKKPPSLPISARPTGVVNPLLESFIHRGNKPPPPPKSATPVIERITTGSSNGNGFWTRENYEKGSHPPPAHMDESPTTRVSGAGVVAPPEQSSPTSHQFKLKMRD